jgi:hypothetical protein
MNAHISANPLETGTDELERFALEECNKRQRVDRKVSVLVMPAGRCELATKFARQGASVIVADQPTRQQETEGRILAAGLRDEISFAGAALPELPEDLPKEPFDIIVLRRGLCSLQYEQARRIIRQLLLRLKIGGKLYVSILGLHSELGEGYPGREMDIEERYAELAPPMVDKYGIQGPVCLYSERNLFMLLLEAGGSVLRTLTTTYGNVKGIAVRV